MIPQPHEYFKCKFGELWNTTTVEYWNTWYGHLNIFRVIWGDRNTANSMHTQDVTLNYI